MIQARYPLALLLGLIVFTGSAPAQETGDGCFLCAETAALVTEIGLRESSTPMRQRDGWAPPKRIVTMLPPQAAMAEFLGHVAPDAEIIDAGGPAGAAEVIAGADVFIGLCTKEIVQKGVNLRWIQIMTAGIESCARFPELKERGVVATNMQRMFSIPMAEHAIGLMLAFSRKLYLYDDQQRAGRWPVDITDIGQRMQARQWEVNGKTMLVAGLGGIGTQVARRAHALGMRVIATRNSRREGPEFVDYVGLSHELNELAAQADVVVSALPLTDKTRDVHDAAFFAAMKASAVFINVGRGETVDTDSLVEALETEQIAGAGLDVTSPEPLPPGHALWQMPNVILTPHVSGVSEQTFRRLQLVMLENLRRYVAGDALLSEVDLERGY